MAARSVRDTVRSAANVKRALERSQTERATRYVEKASRVRLQDLSDNPGSRVKVWMGLLFFFWCAKRIF